MINKKQMMEIVYNQLAIDYNCCPDDFLREGLIFTEAEALEGRRHMYWRTPRLEMITMGNGVIINASSDILSHVKQQLEGKTRYEVLNMPFVYGVNPYYLPDLNNIKLLDKNVSFIYEFIKKENIPKLYNLKDFGYALKYDVNSDNPEMLAIVAKYDNSIVGIASATGDCETMWQINVDVLSNFRGYRLATTLVNALTIEVINLGYIPYYTTDCSNVISQRVAVQAGYLPAWSHCYRTRLELL